MQSIRLALAVPFLIASLACEARFTDLRPAADTRASTDVSAMNTSVVDTSVSADTSRSADDATLHLDTFPQTPPDSGAPTDRILALGTFQPGDG